MHIRALGSQEKDKIIQLAWCQEGWLTVENEVFLCMISKLGALS